MTNEQIIFNEVCSNYDSAQRHDLVSRFYTPNRCRASPPVWNLFPMTTATPRTPSKALNPCCVLAYFTLGQSGTGTA